MGFGGDWSGARYGVVKGINVSFTDQASLSYMDGSTIKQLNLFQRNMFAARIEIEVGFVVRDKNEFVQLNNGIVA